MFPIHTPVLMKPKNHGGNRDGVFQTDILTDMVACGLKKKKLNLLR